MPPSVSPSPTTAELARAKIELLATIAKDGEKFWRNNCGPPASADSSTPGFERALTEACAKHDANAYFEAGIAADAAKSQTCQFGATAYREVFEQIDANTWQETRGPVGICHVTSITTLVRDPDPKYARMWNFREITNVADTTSPACTVFKGVVVVELRWDARSAWQYNCKYFESAF